MDRALHLDPDKAAAEAVKAYLRIHRARIAQDPEMLALMLPERFGDDPNLKDFQHFVIGKLTAELAALKSECEALRRSSQVEFADHIVPTREGVKKLVLNLIAANSLEGAISVARNAAPCLNTDFVSIGVESDAQLNLGKAGINLLPPGIVGRLIERGSIGAVLIGDASRALYPNAREMQSIAIFRMRFGPKTPPALFAVGSADANRFDGTGETREIAYFVRALEATIRAWLNPSRN
jgi:uncharacterized protein YigA (DUF484 family)